MKRKSKNTNYKINEAYYSIIRSKSYQAKYKLCEGQIYDNPMDGNTVPRFIIHKVRQIDKDSIEVTIRLI